MIAHGGEYTVQYRYVFVQRTKLAPLVRGYPRHFVASGMSSRHADCGAALTSVSHLPAADA